MYTDSAENYGKEATYSVLSRAMKSGQISLNKITCETYEAEHKMHGKSHIICNPSQIIANLEDNYIKCNCAVFQNDIDPCHIFIGSSSDFVFNMAS